MPNLTRIRAKEMDIRRRVLLGRDLTLELVGFDPDLNGRAVLGTVSSWYPTILNPLVVGSEQTEFKIAEDEFATPARLRECELAMNGQIYHVVARTEPLGGTEKIWRIRAEPTGERI